MNLSSCCKAEMKVSGGMPEDGDMGTRYYTCLKCGEVCDFYQPMMDFPRPKGWRKGQTIYNFLTWLTEDKYERYYYVSDEQWDKWYEEFLRECEK